MPMETPIRLLIVDDHSILLDGIVALLQEEPQIAIVGTAHNGREAVEKVCLVETDVMLMDIAMPVMDGLQATKIIKEIRPNVRILALSMHDEQEYVTKVIQSGASGYVLKDVFADELLRAIVTVYHKGSYFSAGASNQLAHAVASDKHLVQHHLTAREIEVLKLIAQGMCNKEAARTLNISVRTVEAHRQNLREKLGIQSTAGLTYFAIENEII